MAEKEVGLRHVAALDLLLVSAAPQGEVHLPGVRAIRRYDQLSLRSQPLPPVTPWSLEITGPGLYPLPAGGELRIEAGVTMGERGRRRGGVRCGHPCFSLDRAHGPAG